jgi:hypothetical protein
MIHGGWIKWRDDFLSRRSRIGRQHEGHYVMSSWETTQSIRCEPAIGSVKQSDTHHDCGCEKQLSR